MNKHYICTGGCKAVSETPGVCGALDCSGRGHEFVECNCIDGKHYDFKACVNCKKLCQGNCDIEIFKPELSN
ncbi:hypothetical protein A2645_02200 [Candidatus Nomurabacteria bacterium RIFCSPHIGHO2_01_FULL_39_9]|uniref:Uncharacterized protein n=1 Tax=Candidatus Nomurabacteria bacterium RIFCSPHIGHO2_01_FULL_39_9 TaxID=1801735 RepID=A0A1F6UUY4_9BACT|nr:MAG: hypothetical protein A2645_02200 [Candidatus Nomurabacteria bacterium RIFCSPHIGHO2_01_FULL_39_9]